MIWFRLENLFKGVGLYFDKYIVLYFILVILNRVVLFLFLISGILIYWMY